MTGIGNETQVRVIAEQIAEAAIVKISQQNQQNQPPRGTELPAPLKWAAAIITAIMTTGACAMCIWVVSTLADLQQTVTRIDERQKLSGDSVTKRLDGLEDRVTRIETSSHGEAPK